VSLFAEEGADAGPRLPGKAAGSAAHPCVCPADGAVGANLPGRAEAGPKCTPGGGVPDPYRDLRRPRHDGNRPPVPKRRKNHRAKQAERRVQPLRCAAGNDELYLSAPAPRALAAAVLLGGPDRTARFSGALQAGRRAEIPDPKPVRPSAGDLPCSGHPGGCKMTNAEKTKGAPASV